MTEQNNMSLVDMETANSAHNARLIAAQNLQRAGVENADENTVAILAQEFPAIGKMEALLNEHGQAINSIRNHEETDMELRTQAYAELVDRITPEYEQAARELQADIANRRTELQHQLFGLPEASSPYATGADKHSAQLNYRDALYTVSDSSNEQLARHAELAEMTGDMTLLRACATIAETRGLTVAQAAARLGISEPAVRARIRRGTLQADHTPDGVRVYLAPDTTARGSFAVAGHDTSAHIADLRAALEAERRAHGETRRLLAAALERIPALPPGEAAAQDAEPAGEGYDTPSTPAGDTRPWWRRMFGG